MKKLIVKYTSQDAPIPDGWQYHHFYGHHGANGYGMRVKEVKDEFLEEIAEITKERGQDYDTPIRNHERIAAGWSQILGKEISPDQVVLCMVWTKIARLIATPDHQDSIKDIAGYAWCLDQIRKSMQDM